MVRGSFNQQTNCAHLNSVDRGHPFWDQEYYSDWLEIHLLSRSCRSSCISILFHQPLWHRRAEPLRGNNCWVADHMARFKPVRAEGSSNPESHTIQSDDRLTIAILGEVCKLFHDPNHSLRVLTAVALQRSPDLLHLI